MTARMAISVSIGYANIRPFAVGIFQCLATLSPCGAKIGVLIGRKSSMMDTMHRRKAILSYGASRGVVVLGILLWPMLIATKKIYATRIRTEVVEAPKGQASTLSRTDSETTTAWLDGSGGLGRLRH